MMWKTSVYGIVLTVGIILISCNPRKDPVNKNSFGSLTAVDTKTLVSMISRLNQALAVKDYSADKGIAVLKPLTSTYKVCIPGFTKMVPYDESYLYIYCIYDTKETPPRVLSFRFQLPRSLAQKITMSDIRKPFQKWEKENTFKNPDHTITDNYKINEGNTTIAISQHVLPNQTDGMITEVTLYR
ncbi:hypothetical protein [Pedobacter suwonensis]|nr:hypothetical protein [Pedobacter suwonensis]